MVSNAPTGSKKKGRSGGIKKKKMSEYNKFIQTEMTRLKEDEPDIDGKERWKVAISNWNAKHKA